LGGGGDFSTTSGKINAMWAENGFKKGNKCAIDLKGQ
jgi:hypothetical protein